MPDADDLKAALPPWLMPALFAVVISLVASGVTFLVTDASSSSRVATQMEAVQARLGIQQTRIEEIKKDAQDLRFQTLDKLQVNADNLLGRIDKAEDARARRQEVIDDRLAEVASQLGVLTERVNLWFSQNTNPGGNYVGPPQRR